MAGKALQALNDSQMSSYSYVAFSLLMVYETLLSLNQEVEYIWNAPLSSVKMLYFCTRYGTIFTAVFNLALTFMKGMSTELCLVLLILEDWACAVTVIPITVIMVLRTRALYHYNHKAIIILKAIVVLFIATEITALVMVTIGYQVLETPELAGSACLQRGFVSPVGLAGDDLTFVNAAWCDFVIFIMTIVECLRLLRTRKTKIVWRICCDSAGYYVALTILVAINLVMFTKVIPSRPELANLTVAPLRMLQPIFALKILLKLRQTASELGDPSKLVQDFSMYDFDQHNSDAGSIPDYPFGGL